MIGMGLFWRACATTMTAGLLIGFAACGGATTPTGDPFGAPPKNELENGDASSASDGTATTNSDGGNPQIDSSVDAGSDSGGLGSDPGEVTCGQTTCSRSGSGSSKSFCCSTSFGVPFCTNQENICPGDRITCDEKADCDGQRLCCAGALASNKIATSCQNECITDTPDQVCKTNAECGPNGTCTVYDCGNSKLGFCKKPTVCPNP